MTAMVGPDKSGTPGFTPTLGETTPGGKPGLTRVPSGTLDVHENDSSQSRRFLLPHRVRMQMLILNRYRRSFLLLLTHHLLHF